MTTTITNSIAAAERDAARKTLTAEAALAAIIR
jgi:hypothetical protein